MSIPEVQSRSRLLAFLKNFFAEKSSTSKAAPTDASYLTLGTNGDLSAERVLTAGTNISFTDGGAGGTLTIDASGGGGGGDVSVSGTPSNNQVPTWTNSTTIKGESNLTFDGNTLTIAEPTSADTLVIARASGQASIKAATSDHMIIDSDGQYLSLNHYEDDNVVLGYGGGNVGVGPNSSPAHLLTVATDVSSEAVSSVTQYNNSTAVDGPNLILQRARGTMASPAIVQDDDNLGSLRWYSYDGSNFDLSAGIMAECDATPGSNDTPGRLLFSTTADGSNSLTERMRIASDGLVTIAGDLKVGDADIYGQTDGPLRLKADTNMYFDCDDDADGAGHFYWRNGANTTVAELDESGDLVVGGTLQVSGDWIKSDAGPTIEFSSATAIELSNDLNVVGDIYTTTLDANSVQLGLVTSYIKDQSGTNRIVIQNNGHVGFVDSTGVAAFTVFDTYSSTASDLAVGGNVQCGGDTSTEMTLASGEIQFFAKGDDLMELTQTGVGIRGATPIAGLAVTGDIEASGDLTVTGNDIKGSGGTAITMDGSNNVTVAGDLTVTGGGITLGMANGYIKDAGGTNRITIADDTSVALLSPAGNAEFVVYETYCKTMSDLAVGGNVQCLDDTDTQMTLASGAIQFFGKGDDLMELTQTGVGIRGATPIAGLAVTGDIEASGDLDVDGVLTVGDGDLADGNYLLKLNSDRAWAFIQYGNGSGAALKLQNVTGPNKNFIVQTNGETRFYNSSGVEKFVIENSTGDTDSAGTKNFNIEHPLKSGYRLRHTSIEGPLCDLIYRGRITLDGNEGVVDVDSQFGMTIGTYAALTKNPQVFLQNSTGWSPVRVKSFSEGILTIESQSADNDEVCWMVVATRRDTGVMESNSTDENGDLIVEFENIEEEPYDEDPIDE